jgi:glycine cleavage system H protein
MVGDAVATIGITDFAQELLGEISFIAFPRIGDRLRAQEPCAMVESSKVVCDVRSPLSGTVLALNQQLADSWKRVNQQPYRAWLIQLRLEALAELVTLLDPHAYRELLMDARFSSGSRRTVK